MEHNPSRRLLIAPSIEAENRGENEHTRDEIHRTVCALLDEYAPGSWLDFGCATGTLLGMYERDIERHGFDQDERALKAALNRGLAVTQQWEETPDVECITAIDVIEHMYPEEVIEWLQRWYAKLKPQGVLMVSTLNPESLLVWCQFWHDSTHVRPYSEVSLTALAQAVGFTRDRLVMAEQRTRRRPQLRLLRKIMSGLGLWPDLGSDFDRYYVIYRK